jgi:putative tricarboxylic transport membrane protein
VTGRDRVAAVVLVAFGVVALQQATHLRIGSIVRPGPGFFPVVLAAGFTLVCVALAVRAFRSRIASDPVAASLSFRKMGATIAALFVYALVLERVGFVVSTFALLLFFFRGLERQRWTVALAGSIVTACVTYLVFKVWLHVQLPPGPWGS